MIKTHRFLPQVSHSLVGDTPKQIISTWEEKFTIGNVCSFSKEELALSRGLGEALGRSGLRVGFEGGGSPAKAPADIPAQGGNWSEAQLLHCEIHYSPTLQRSDSYGCQRPDPMTWARATGKLKASLTQGLPEGFAGPFLDC